jgi:hypothetical protein
MANGLRHHRNSRTCTVKSPDEIPVKAGRMNFDKDVLNRSATVGSQPQAFALYFPEHSEETDRFVATV